MAALHEALQRAGLARIGKDTVHEAVDLRAKNARSIPSGTISMAWNGMDECGL